MGIEPTFPENESGCSIAVELRDSPRSGHCCTHFAALSLLSYIRSRFRLECDNPQRAAHRNEMVKKPGLAPGPSPLQGQMLLLQRQLLGHQGLDVHPLVGIETEHSFTRRELRF